MGLRLLRAQAGKARFVGTGRRQEQLDSIRAHGARPLRLDLDRAATAAGQPPEDTLTAATGHLARLTGLANHIIYLAPPSTDGERDHRLRRVLAQLDRRKVASRLRMAYCSTSGVYGDAAGRLLTESTPINPQSTRAKRRADAERQLRRRSKTSGSARMSINILRAPGIYAQERLPLTRLQKRTPALTREHDSYSSHIHADDLARSLWMAMLRGAAGRTFNASDGDQQLMGDYFDQVAEHFGLPRPRRLAPEAIKAEVTPMMWSFMRESRRLSNRRLRSELKVKLRYPNVAATLATMPRGGS
ncbi:MAG: NAD-dependent epimerase/dehydratase family protein [Burkholderiaceae bacterium]